MIPTGLKLERLCTVVASLILEIATLDTLTALVTNLHSLSGALVGMLSLRACLTLAGVVVLLRWGKLFALSTVMGAYGGAIAVQIIGRVAHG